MVLLHTLVASAIPCVLAMASGGQTPPTHPAATPPKLVRLLDRAKKASVNNPASVRAVVDEVFDSTVFNKMPESVRDRVTRADITYRTDKHDGIREQDIAKAMNSLMTTFGLTARNSPFGKTSVGQIQRFRRVARAMVPSIGAEDGKPVRASDVMSPVEALYIMTGLLTQQLYNPRFKVTPEQWCKNYDDAHSGVHAAGAAAAHSSVLSIQDDDTVEILNALSTLDDEGGAGAMGVHLLLDALGLDR